MHRGGPVRGYAPAAYRLAIAMITLKLWQLAALAVPLIVLLAVQTVLMFVFANFVIYNVMGRNYDAAVLAAGSCGFSMGATPNVMANIQALTSRLPLLSRHTSDRMEQYILGVPGNEAILRPSLKEKALKPAGFKAFRGGEGGIRRRWDRLLSYPR